jgi:glycosyltransferase involved in cell wall biosynthesis
VTHDVAIVTRFYSPYTAGAEVQVARLARYVASTGAYCEVVTSRYRRDLRKSESDGGVQVRRLVTGAGPVARPIEFIRALLYFAKNGSRFEVVHAYCLSSFTLGALIGARIRGVRTIVSACTIGATGDIPRVKGALGGGLMWRLFMGADVLLARSPVAREDLRAHGAPERKLVVLPGIAAPVVDLVPTAAHRSAARGRIGLPNRPTVLYVGRLEPAKGLETLIEAWPQVIAAHDAQLVLVGEGPLRGWAVHLARIMERPDTIRAVGWLGDPRPYYEASDVFVFPSRSESFGVALADAMAAGVAVVATPTGLGADWLRDQEDGLIVPQADAPALASALGRLLADESERRRLSDNARRRAQATFGVEAVGAAYLELARRLAAREPVRPANDAEPAEHWGA